MKKINYLKSILVVSLCVTLFYSCDKDDAVLPVNDLTIPTNNTNSTSSNLCTGDGTTNPLPLSIGNRWYSSKKTGGWNSEITVKQTVIKNGKEYFEVSYDEGGNGSWTTYLRVDSNGDIYELEQYTNGNEAEHMLIPRNPTDGQKWPYRDIFLTKNVQRRVRVVDVNEDHFLALDLGDCKITKYYIIDEITEAGSIITNTAYAPGVGFIGDITYNKLSELKLN